MGAGQEEDAHGDLQTNKENSFVVQPISDMDTNTFIAHIQQLLFNPTEEGGSGPFLHSQWGALVKLPSYPQAFLIFHQGHSPSGPQDYTGVKVEGDTAGPRTIHDLAYTQMRYGPRAEPSMMDPTDRPDDVGSPQPGTGKPGAGLPGKRFAIKKGNQP